jgi:chitinase
VAGGNTGSFNAVYLSNLTCTGSPIACTGGLYLYEATGGTISLITNTSVPCHNGSSLRAIVHGAQGAVYVDNILYLLFTPITPSGSSMPGIGANGTTNGIMNVSLGSIDTVAPNAVNASLVSISELSSQVYLQWEPVLDNQGGIGVAYYDIYRGGTWLSHSRTAQFVDNAVAPGTNYSYWIVPVDYHLNSVTTTVTAETAAPSAVDGRRVGIRSTGTYWGGGGEQIDMRSGNLNFTQPLLKPMGRGGWGVPINLSYNSQNWRQPSTASTSLLGADTIRLRLDPSGGLADPGVQGLF